MGGRDEVKSLELELVSQLLTKGLGYDTNALSKHAVKIVILYLIVKDHYELRTGIFMH